MKKSKKARARRRDSAKKCPDVTKRDSECGQLMRDSELYAACCDYYAHDEDDD